MRPYLGTIVLLIATSPELLARKQFSAAISRTSTVMSPPQGAHSISTISGRFIRYPLQVGPLSNSTEQDVVVASQIVQLPEDVAWARLIFSSVSLPSRSKIQVTSLLDGDYHSIDEHQAVDWGMGTAFLNGSRFLVELIAGPGATGVAFTLERALANALQETTQVSICDATDHRAPSTRPEVARLLVTRNEDPNIGVCTAFMIDVPTNGPDKCFLSAGHCFDPTETVPMAIVQFVDPTQATPNTSNADCTLVMPAAAKQFTIAAGVLFQNNGIGNDWAKFHCPRNPVTNKFPFEEQGSALPIFIPSETTPQIPLTGSVRVTGYGEDGNAAATTNTVNATHQFGSACECDKTTNVTGTRNHIQQEHNETYQVQGPSQRPFIQHQVDTCAGNSGSPIVVRAGSYAGLVIGIHTAGTNCHLTPTTVNINYGTPITQPALRQAIKDREGPPIPSCGQKDDGTTENSLGLTAGGELGWIKTLNCPIGKHDTVSTAYGTLQFPGSVTNGAASQVVVYTNQSGTLDPNAPGWIVTTKINTVVVNGDTDILNDNTYASTNVPPTKSVMVLASAVTLAGQFPGPMDQSFANPNAWVCGQTGGGALNTTNLAANALPPLNMGAIGFPSTWLLRISDTTSGSGPGTPLCFGDGSSLGCPCGNAGAAGAGCATRFPGDPAGIQCPATPTNVGTTLTASGSNSLALQGNPATRLVLTAINTTTQPGLFFSGINTIAGGSGVVFGDGKRCCGGQVKRLQLTDLPGQGPGVNCPATGSTTVDLTSVTPGTVLPGLKLCYQYWYRNPGARSLCGTNFNLSNAITITWTP